MTDTGAFLALILVIVVVGCMGIYWATRQKPDGLDDPFKERRVVRSLKDIDFDEEENDEHSPTYLQEERLLTYVLEPEGGFWIRRGLFYLMYEDGTPVSLVSSIVNRHVPDALSPLGFLSRTGALEYMLQLIEESGDRGKPGVVVSTPRFHSPELGWEPPTMFNIYSGDDLIDYWEEQGDISGDPVVEFCPERIPVQDFLKKLEEVPPDMKESEVLAFLMQLKKAAVV